MLIPDMDKALGELRGLVELARLNRFDLFVYLRELNDLGTPILRADIDPEGASGASDHVVRYQLDNGLKALLAALRAGDLHPNVIKGRSGRRRAPGDSRNAA